MVVIPFLVWNRVSTWNRLPGLHRVDHLDSLVSIEVCHHFLFWVRDTKFAAMVGHNVGVNLRSLARRSVANVGNWIVSCRNIEVEMPNSCRLPIDCHVSNFAIVHVRDCLHMTDYVLIQYLEEVFSCACGH